MVFGTWPMARPEPEDGEEKPAEDESESESEEPLEPLEPTLGSGLAFFSMDHEWLI